MKSNELERICTGLMRDEWGEREVLLSDDEYIICSPCSGITLHPDESIAPFKDKASPLTSPERPEDVLASKQTRSSLKPNSRRISMDRENIGHPENNADVITASPKVNGGNWTKIRPMEIDRMRKIFLHCLEKQLHLKLHLKENERCFFKPDFAKTNGYQIVAPVEFSDLFKSERAMFHWKPEVWNCIALLLKDKYIKFARPGEIAVADVIVRDCYIKKGKEKTDGWEELFGPKPLISDLLLRPSEGKQAIPATGVGKRKTNSANENDQDKDGEKNPRDMKFRRCRKDDLTYDERSDMDDLLPSFEMSDDDTSSATSEVPMKNKKRRLRSTQTDTTNERHNQDSKKRKTSDATISSSSSARLVLWDSDEDSAPPMPNLISTKVPPNVPPLPSSSTGQRLQPRRPTAFSTTFRPDRHAKATDSPAKNTPCITEILHSLSDQIKKVQKHIITNTNPISQAVLEKELDHLNKRDAEWLTWLEAEQNIENSNLNDSSKERMRVHFREMIKKEIEEKGIFGEKK